MSKCRLAVSGSLVVLVCLAVSAGFAQTSSNPPKSTATAADQTPKVSDEEMGRLYLVRKQYREAQDVFHKLTLEQPKNPQYWNELGIAFHNQEELGSALKCYEKSAKLDKHYPDAQNNIGTVYYARKKYPKAIRSYKRAIAIKEDFAPFYLNLGYAYFADKQYEDSISSFRKALQIDPDAFESTRSRSGTVVQDRSISSDRARFYFLLAKSFAEAGNVERCAAYLKKARDEGYQDMSAVNSDPSFAKIAKEPAIQEVLAPKSPDDAAQP
jgi:tetratricopeptide (TPR) repeat protein